MSESPLEETKPDLTKILQDIDELGADLRALILVVKTLPRNAELDIHQEPLRCLSVAQTNLQTGLMWLRRAVEQPKVF